MAEIPFEPYTGQGKLRFWCQKVLPLVYDDSLSYYELLGKVVEYLNNTISDVGACEDNITALRDAFVQLQNYVNEQLDDFAPEVERIIDEMVDSGEFGEILSDAVNGLIANEYSTTQGYAQFDYVIKDGKLYCATASTSGEWDSTKWRETTVGADMQLLNQRVYNLNAGQVAFNESATYSNNTVGKKLKDLDDFDDNLNAGQVGYNSESTYNNATVGKELQDLKGSLNSNNLLNGSQYYKDNIFNPIHSINNRYINTNTGGQQTDNNYFATGYIPVSPNTSYKSNYGRNIAWYDSNKTYISGVSGTGIQTGLTSPTNAAYLRISFSKTVDTWSPMFVNVQPTASYNETIVDFPFYVAKSTWLQGKRVAWYGDSIVAGKDFDDIVCSHYGMILFDYGINGSTMGFASDGSDERNATCWRILTNAQFDLVIVSAGTNDFEYAWQPMGDMSSTAASTFYGALHRACQRALTGQKGNLVVFTTPIKRGQPFADGAGGTYTADGVTLTPDSKNKYGYTLGDYANAIKEVCAYYSIPVLDLYNESQLNPFMENQQVFFDDVLTHPNATGQKIMARRVIGWLNQLGADMETMSYD